MKNKIIKHELGFLQIYPQPSVSELENFISKTPVGIINSFYKNLAQLGLGRSLTIFITPF